MDVRQDVRQGEPSEHHQGQEEGPDGLAVELGNLARDLQHQPQELLTRAIVEAAVEIIPGVEGGSISVVVGRKTISSEAPTSDIPAQLDAIQMQERQGPCLDAAYEQQTVRVPDLATETRWPVFARRAVAETGVASMLSFQLFVEDDDLGALNLYSTHTDAFTDESEHVGLLVAAHAAVAFAGSRQAAQLREAVGSRDIIGQAKGILMERYKITSEQAFVLLVRASSRTNRKVHDLAQHLADTGEIYNALQWTRCLSAVHLARIDTKSIVNRCQLGNPYLEHPALTWDVVTMQTGGVPYGWPADGGLTGTPLKRLQRSRSAAPAG